VIAPASANSLARFAGGLADEPVSMCMMAALVPKIVVPAMNFAMYQAPATQRNLSILRTDGVHIIEPDSGRLACGEEGYGRFPEIQTIVSAIRECLAPKTVLEKTVLITAGRTEEPIDPVRVITNHSSGKTGVALADAFLQAGFRVIVVQGPMEAKIPKGATIIRVQTALEMHAAVLEKSAQCDALVFAAAVADYRPKSVSAEKLKDSRSQLSIELESNPNILHDSVQARHQNQVIVGFALETVNAVQYGLQKLERSGADLLVLNTPVKSDSGFGKDSVEFCLLKAGQVTSHAPVLMLGSKLELAQEVVSAVKEMLHITSERRS
jgi:phosphopantothenoylcysteine decarboxylase/phosphopantothenate--cysteine ligase